MNNPNPFLPQGAFLDQKNKAQARLKIAVISSISVSVVVLMGLLIQGCKKPNDGGDTAGLPAIDTNTTATQLSSNPPADMGSASNSMATTLPPITNPTPMVSTPPPVAPPVTPPPPPVAEMQEYTIVKGDSFATIASHNNTTAKAIEAANPGVDPKKLKIGQKIKLPAAATQSTSVSPTTAPTAMDSTATGGVITHTVKSGDTLTTISKHYHVTIKAIQQANNLTTTAIKVGQKLKIPGAAAPAPAPAEPAPVPAPAPGPATTTPPPAH
jgi:LysM repeat protein